MGRCLLLITHIRNGHQTTTITTTSHWSRESDCFSGPTGKFGNGHQNKARYYEINVRDACDACYFAGKFATGVPIEARYSVVSVCNELYLTPVTDT
jgi:hypothetical protein